MLLNRYQKAPSKIELLDFYITCISHANFTLSDDSEKTYANTSKLVHVAIFTRLILDVATFWTQALFCVALALERYIYIVEGTRAKQILTPQRRLKFYSGILTLSLSVPVFVVCDFALNMRQYSDEVWKFFLMRFKFNPSSEKSTSRIQFQALIICYIMF